MLAIRLNEGDTLAAAGLCADGGAVLLASSGGKVAGFEVSEGSFRAKGRASHAIKVRGARAWPRGWPRSDSWADRAFRPPAGVPSPFATPPPTAQFSPSLCGTHLPTHPPSQLATHQPSHPPSRPTPDLTHTPI